MATIQIVDNFSNNIADTVQTAFTASINPIVIEAITAANNSSVNASYSFYIQSSAGPLQAQVQDKIVVWGENDLAIGAVNQVIPPGGALKVKSSAIDSIYFTVTGRTIDN